MRIEGFDWNDAVVDKLEAKHHVQMEEVEEAAFNKPHIRRAEAGLHYLYGRTEAGRYLFIVVRYLGGGLIRPITAMDMNAAQRRLYRKAVGLS